MASAKSTAAVQNDDVVIDDREPRLYECCILYAYPLPQKEEAQLLKEIDALFQEAGAKLVDKDVWGRRGIAFPMKGFTEASVIVTYWELLPEKIAELERALRIMKHVLRHLFVKPPKGYQILKYGQLYEQWLKERESVEQKRAREREEHLREQVAAKARRKAQLKTERKVEAKPKEAVSEEVIGKEIEKLISDDTLEI